MTVVLLHSPLLGPASWSPVAALLPGAVVPDLRRIARQAPPYWNSVVETVAAQVPAGPLTLVPHSNAGLFVPLLCQALEVERCVFVDALLPPAEGSVSAGKDEQVAFLRKLADLDGVLPRWTDWWMEPDVAALFPSQEIRRRVSEEQPRLPLDYFEQTVPVPSGWDARPCTYLWYGPPYGDDAREAQARGWTVEQIPGHHLHHLADPEAVAARL
ncbi:alpha/beta fold hydrolase [Nonomuraea soli]|uniref:Pimeloyl-ACP methyl ester carboxylesterase n=1 Tax=Nonomuraea soli TaxID=1032476 RepID=A0A7W0HN25_9ACTN|nr:alpha/beta fold hydrolase [Nonomuraea soli]MBA2889359.1 pimeloyl-ACP methyl ester carboxylesterase [Nonomuraea soli]